MARLSRYELTRRMDALAALRNGSLFREAAAIAGMSESGFRAWVNRMTGQVPRRIDSLDLPDGLIVCPTCELIVSVDEVDDGQCELCRGEYAVHENDEQLERRAWLEFEAGWGRRNAQRVAGC